MPLAVRRILNVTTDVQRAIITQGSIGGAKYDWKHPQIVIQGIKFNIQSMRPTDIDYWQQRGIAVSHKAYTDTPITGTVLIGDRIPDPRYPGRVYTVAFVEDMGGVGKMFGIFMNLIQ